MSQSDFVTRGQALVSSGQYQEAVKVCRLGLLGRPTTVEGRVVLGQALLALKRYDEVLAEMRVALELDHASLAAQVLKGEALLRKGDGHGAMEALGNLRGQGSSDAHIGALVAEAERLVSRAPPGGQSAIGYVSQDASAFAADQGTKNYPAHLAELQAANGAASEDNGEYTRPTSLAAPGKKRATPAPGPADEPGRERPAWDESSGGDGTPSPAVLAVGDRSGTVEVDPEVEGTELGPGEDDLGDVVAPPVGRRGANRGAMDDMQDRSRGSVKPSTRSPRSAGAANRSGRSMFKEEVSTVELDDDEMIEVDESASSETTDRGVAFRPPGPATAVRNAVKMPSGPIDLASPMAGRAPGRPLPVPGPPAQLAQLIANQPHVMKVVPQPQINPRSAIAAALPTAAALPMPGPMQPPPMAMPQQMPPPMAMPQQIPQHLQQTMLAAPQPPQGPPMYQLPAHLSSNLAAARPTIGLNPLQQESAAVVDSLFNGNGDGQRPAWARPTMLPGGPPGHGPGRAGGDDPGRQPREPEPQATAMLAGQGPGGVPAASFTGDPSGAMSRSARTAGRKARSRLQIAVWVMIGAAVIGGGVFAGFQIRALRLRRQIAAARDRAVDLAKADTWQGWLGARDSLYSIAQASPTIDNKAALARARAVLAFEFGDGVADARAAVDALAGRSDTDLDLATAYLALAQSDAKLAHDAAERALRDAPNDAAALYVTGQAALVAGDVTAAIAALRSAVEREPRPLYTVGLARALAAGTVWDEALATIDRARDNPSAVIAKGFLIAAAGRVAQGQAGELRAQLVKLIADGQKPGDQDRVSPFQVAFADLALAQVDFARNDLGAARADYLASLALSALGTMLDDQRFAEEICDTMYAIGELEPGRTAVTRALASWPGSRRVRTTLAQIWLGFGSPTTALDVFTKAPDVVTWPRGQTVRGLARRAAGDVDGARADFDAVLKKLPGFEPAVIARSWIDVASGDLDAARRRIEPRFNPKTATTAMVTIYAAILRASGDPAARSKAKALFDRVLGGPPSPDAARAQLELARIDRDLGDLHGAREAYAEASRLGNPDARLESGLLLIDDGDLRGGTTTLEQLLKEAGDHPTAALLLEVARARALLGDHPRAAVLLALADNTPGVARWQLDRERGRLALRKGDIAGAGQALGRALDGCGADPETFLLAADTITAEDSPLLLAQKLKPLLPVRLKGTPELEIISGKLALAAANGAPEQDEAEKLYNSAREALMKENASRRRRAQADFGLAAVAYYKGDDPTALTRFNLMLLEDPSLYVAYLFAADIAGRKKESKKALELALHAVEFNPDFLEGWRQVGVIAAGLGNRKVLGDAITHANSLQPGGEVVRQLQKLR